MNGLLHFNKCSEITIERSCGDEPVKGRFVFVNYTTNKNVPKCVVFREKDPEEWKYSTFLPDSEVLKLEGVSAKEPEMEIEYIGGNPGLYDILEDEIHKQIKKNIPGAKFIYDILESPNDHPQAHMKLEKDKEQEMLFKKKMNKEAMDQSANIQETHTKNKSQIFNRILTKSSESDQKKQLRLKLDETIKVEFYYFCSDDDPKMTSKFDHKKNVLTINEYSKNGCLTEFYFLKFLSQVPWLTGLVFAAIGIMLILGGFKIYHNIFIALVPVVVLMLGFFLYFVLMDKTETPFMNLLTLAGILLVMILSILLIVYLQSYFFFVFAFLVSFQLAFYFKNFLEQYCSLFEESYMYTALILVFYITFIIIYSFTENLFVVLTTVIFGTIMLIISLRYFGITSYDLLLDTQLNKFNQFDHFDPEAKKIIFVFLGLLVFGIIFQFVMMCVLGDKEDEDDSEFLDETAEDIKHQDPESQIKSTH